MKIQKKDVKDILPLTPMQEGMLFHYLTGDQKEYLEHLSIHLEGKMDETAFQESWNQVVETHDVLRSTFKWKKLDKPIQIILKNKNPEIRIYRQEQGRTKEECEAEVFSKIKEDGIDLNEIPFYIILCLYGDSSCMHLVFHHILMDGWSIGIIVRQFLASYRSLITGCVQEKEQYGNFKDYIVSRESLYSEDEEKAYWKEALEGYQIKNGVRPLFRSDSKKSYMKTERNLPVGLYKAMEQFCQNTQVTMANLFYTAWGLMAERFIYDTDRVFGTTISGRNADIPGIVNTVGLFINTIPVRIKADADQTAADMVLAVQRSLSRRQKFEQTSLSAIGQYIGIQAKDLFDTIIVIENYPLALENKPEKAVTQMFEISGFEMEEYTSYPLSVIVDARNSYKIKLLYDIGMYETFLIESMLDSLLELLKDMTKNPYKTVKELNMLTKEAQDHILHKFNDTITDYPREENIISLFKQNVEKHPHKAAIVYEEKRMTYKELDQKSDVLAALLVKAGTKKEQCVGLMCNHKPEMIVAMLGILKAQGAYVPISSEYPKDRKEFILKDIKASVLVCNCGYVPSSDVKVIDLREELVCEEPGKNLEDYHTIRPEQLAYLIYTSGSTGNPKGIMIEHKGILRLVQNTNYVVFSEEDKVLPTCPLEFDVSNFEIWGTLLNGAEVYLLDKEKMLSPQILEQFIKDNEISLMWMTTPLFNQMAQVQPSMFLTLRYLIVGGDALSPYHIARVRNICRDLVMVNGYGPTENAVFSTAFQIERDYESRVPIGYPISNSTAYILDPYGKLAPIGALGELCTGLDGVARGYYGNEALTNEKFVKDIVFTNRKMYRTGDFARFMPDGVIDFFGRMDYQVKVSGFRIELTEIESVLNSYDGVKDCAVIVSDREEFDKQLTAFIQQEKMIEIDALKKFMSKQLPIYCVPSRFVLMDQLPITINGKIDRKALKKLTLEESIVTASVSTGSETELKIKTIWEGVLKKPAKGLDVNFFEMGGTSLHLIQISNQIQKELGMNITVVDLFMYTTIRSLSSFLDDRKEEKEEYEDKKSKIKQEEHEDNNSEIKLEESEEKYDIAVIGMSGRFPGAQTLERFYENIRDGRECISFFTKEELKDYIDNNSLNDANYVLAKGVLEGSEYFDAQLFGYSDREAELMDPQLRMLHECIFHAFEDAGYRNDKVMDAGLFIGASPNFEWLMRIHFDTQDGAAAWEAANLNFYSLAAPVAYKMNMQGPVLMESTACSSSLVSLHMACRSLISGECEMAAAGGVSLSLPVKSGYQYQEGMIKSPDGRCMPFLENSKGTVSGDGVGIVILKPLSKAVRDRDHIYAVIKGSAVNNDGSRKAGFTAPSVEGQCQVIRSAMEMAGVNGEKVRYIETHGTGTPIGDAIELKALKEAYGKEHKVKAALGSIKASIGHLDSAAGIAGFIKTALCLERGIIPPYIHKGTPNKLLADDTTFYLNSECIKWNHADGIYQAGISSFGIGGTNVHMILEEPPVKEYAKIKEDKWNILPFSAQTKEAIIQQCVQFAALCKSKKTSIQSMAYMLQTGRKEMKFRRAFIADTGQDFADQLMKAARKEANGLLEKSVEERKVVVFLFPGQGTQYLGVCKELYQNVKLYREVLDACFGLLAPEYEYVKEYLLGSVKDDVNPEEMNQTENAQPLLFVLEYSLAKTLEKLGIKPDAMIGHSLGEYTAAAVSGVLTFQECFTLIVARAKLMQKMKNGAMLSVALSVHQIQAMLDQQVKYDIATINAPEQVVISGSKEDMELAEYILTKQNAAFVNLHVSHAFHSYMMEPMLEEFREELKKVTWKKPVTPYISNYTGNYITDQEAADVDYYLKHLRYSVLFEKGIQVLLTIKNAVFVETGAGDVLTKLIMRYSGGIGTIEAISLLPGAKKEQEGSYIFTKALASLWEVGCQVNWSALYGNNVPDKLSLPGYPFDRKKYWKYGNAAYKREKADSSERVSMNALSLYEPVWKSVNKQKLPGSEAIKGGFLLIAGQDEYALSLEEKLIEESRNYCRIDYDSVDNLSQLQADEYGRINVLLLISEQSWKLQENETKLKVYQQVWEESNHASERIMRVILILKKLYENFKKKEVFTMLVTSGAEKVKSTDDVNPFMSMIKSLVKTATDEYPNFKFGCLDVGKKHRESFAETVTDGFFIYADEPVQNQFLSYRDKQYKALGYKLIEQKLAVLENQALQYHGVYLITGGLGGIGLFIAQHLASVYRATLVLLTHSYFPESEDWEEWIANHGKEDEISKKIQRIRNIERQGSVVRVKRASLSNQEEIATVIKNIKDEFSRLHGVFHVAGIGDQTILNSLSEEHLEEVFEPKVKGTACLYSQLAASSFEELGFVVLFSSLASITGGIGQAAYACANAFLDSFAELANSYGIPTLCINWDTWKETGMAVNAVRDLERQASGKKWGDVAGCYICEKKDVDSKTRIYKISLGKEKQWFLQEHKLNGIPILPGTAYLDIVYECVCDYLKISKVKFEEFIIQKALLVEKEQDIFVVLRNMDENVSIQVMDEEVSDAGLFASGTAISLEGSEKYEAVPPEIFLPLSARNFLECENIRTENAEIEYGSRWSVINGIHYLHDRKRAICEAVLPKHYHKDMEHYRLHPAMFDIAMSFILKVQVKDKSYMPFGYKDLCIYGPLEPHIICMATIQNLQVENELLPVECTVMNKNQDVLLHIGQFLIKETDGKMTGTTVEGRYRNQSLQIEKTGDPGSLYWKECEQKIPEDNEVEIEVCTTGVNFKEVLYTLGMLGDSFANLEFGLECAGVVTAKGANVTKWQIGDAVMGMVSSGFSRYVTAKEDLLMKIPDSISFEQAATIPVAFITAYYALALKGQIKKGDKVLIHSATGGVGQAAVQVGQHKGACLYVTAGSGEKRTYLKKTGLEHIYNSRTTEFATQIENENVRLDVVLNSIAGESAERSMSLLRKHGIFLELGIRNEADDKSTRRILFEKAIDYCPISTDYEIPEYTSILDHILAGLQEGYYKPLHYTAFPAEQVSKAFSYMAASRHIGKVVICHESMKKYRRNNKMKWNILRDRGIRTRDGIELLFNQLKGMDYTLSRRVIVSEGKLFSQNYEQEQMLGLLDTDFTREKKPRPVQKTEYEKPLIREELEIVKVFEDFTGISPVGVNDNFFELGVTSLDIIQINNRINKIYTKDSSILKLYTYPTCRQLGAYLAGKEGTKVKLEEFKKNQEELKLGRNKTVDILNKRRLKS